MKNGPEEAGEAMILAPMESHGLAVAREPEIVLAEAHKAAAALKKVIDSKKKKVTFNGETYLEYEDWLTVARFYGVTARIREVKHVQYGEVRGFEAFAEALLVGTGQIISAADAMCLNDEKNWNTRPVYEWQNGQRKKIADEPVPLFQLRSMAQTRACAKCLRNVLAWVVVLAGYKPTPAEEMDGVTHDAPKQPQAAPAVPAPKEPQPSPNQAQAGDFLTIHVSQVYQAHAKAKPAKPGEEPKPGKLYFWVKDGEKSWPCFDMGLFDKLLGQQGETVTLRMEQGTKGAHIVGIAEPGPPRTLLIDDGDLPVPF